MAMIDVGNKGITERIAVAEAEIHMAAEVVQMIRDGKIPKGDVLAFARTAGILAAKETPSLIPLCHPIPIEYAHIDYTIEEHLVRIEGSIKGHAKTGFEMEALTAVSMAALTIYDMCKPHDKSMVINNIRLLKKSGGKSNYDITEGKHD
jgi:cyclic pyranopterin monophosphate synthase